MSKLLLLACLLLVFIFPKPAQAADNCSNVYKSPVLITFDTPVAKNIDSLLIGVRKEFTIKIKIPTANVDPNWQYFPEVLLEPSFDTAPRWAWGDPVAGRNPNSGTEKINGVNYSVFHYGIPNGLPTGTEIKPGLSDFNEFRVYVRHAESPGKSTVCVGPPKQIKTVNSALTEVSACPLTMSDNNQAGLPVTGTVNLPALSDIKYLWAYTSGDLSRHNVLRATTTNPTIYGDAQATFNFRTTLIGPGSGVGFTINPAPRLEIGTYTVAVFATNGTTRPSLAAPCGFRVFEVTTEPTTPPIEKGGVSVVPGKGAGISGKGLSILQGGPKTTAAGISCNGTGVETVLGCVPTEPTEFVKTLIRFATGIAGGIAFLLMLVGSFQMITSAGNPEALKAGQERFRDAVIGLLFIIFSTLLLKIIGIDILGLGKAFGI